jgi:hypothetical protein
MLNKRTVILSIVNVLIFVFFVPQMAGASGSGKAFTGELRGQWQDRVMCSTLPPRNSIHSAYVEGLGKSLTFTEDGPTGVDDGLINLYSSYRTCAR